MTDVTRILSAIEEGDTSSSQSERLTELQGFPGPLRRLPQPPAHTFVTNLCEADISLKTAQTLARHCDTRLTMDVYSHVDEQEQADAIWKLPGLGGGKKREAG